MGGKNQAGSLALTGAHSAATRIGIETTLPPAAPTSVNWSPTFTPSSSASSRINITSSGALFCNVVAAVEEAERDVLEELILAAGRRRQEQA